MLEVANDVFVFMFRTFDTKGSTFGTVCLVASVEVQRSCWGFRLGL